MDKRLLAIVGAVGILALLAGWWWLGSSAELDPSPGIAAENEPVTQDEQERLDTLDQLEGELKAITEARGEIWSPPEVVAPRPEGFDASVLAESGMSEREIRRVRNEIEKIQGEEARLREEARAVGRGPNPTDLANVRSGLVDMHEDLGDEDFDRLLYAAGEDNRVAIKLVMPSSPVAGAGLVKGDVILSYNGQNVYDRMDLHILARASRSSEKPIPFTYERDAQAFTGVIKGGDLGALLIGFSVRP